jgi:membrane complex biogenesis BtpA family protein
MNKLTFLSPLRPAVIGMVHLHALPGTPAYAGDDAALLEAALTDARALVRGGVDALLIENMHDTPYLRGQVGPEIVAMATALCAAVRREVALPIGLQLLAGANREALAVAKATGLDFIRAEGFVFAHVGDEGLHQSDAGELLRYRRSIGADHVAVLADIKKKHSAHSITADVNLEETAQAAEFFRADGVIVTGSSTGHAADAEEVRRAKGAVGIPVIVGSGVTAGNVRDYPFADALIVGSSLKREGRWQNAVDADRVHRLMEALLKGN